MVASLAAGWAMGCANQGTPPGGSVDQRPPVVVRTEPDTFAVVEDLGRPVRFHFDERISEQVTGGTLDDAVTVSPQGGAVRVRHGSRTLNVEVEGGLHPGVVYRVTLLPVVRDLFGNQLRDPFELVFSTGAELTPSALAGEVWDRISGQGVRGALVHAVGADSVVHLARADDQGIFAFRYLPAGTFQVTGFDDVDRNGEAGDREVKGSLPAALAPGDTLLLDIPVIPPDTTAAVLARASALDSLTIVLELDDYLDPAADAGGARVELEREVGESPAVSRLFHEHEYTAYVAAVTDSLSEAGTSTPDTAAAAPRPARVGPTPLPGVRGSGARGGPSAARATGAPPRRVLPGRRLVGLLDAPLEAEVEYRVRVDSVVNLNGLPGGGGEATLLLEEPPPPDTGAVPDSVEASPPDTLPPPDAATPPDTVSGPGGGPGSGGTRP